MDSFVLVCVSAAFYVTKAAEKPEVIDYQNQEEGDIMDLRRNIHGPMLNALRPNSPNKWTIYPDSNGNFTIPFVILGNYAEENRKVIFDAMEKLSRNTCIRFKPRTHEQDFFQIMNERDGGCYAYVGRPLTGTNTINLEHNEIRTCMEPRVVIHELMHVVGLWHEHMREDRDYYIKVHFENVKTEPHGKIDAMKQFEKINNYVASTYGVPYDYLSIMHYAKNFFGKPGTITMRTLDPRYQNVIGTVTEPSANDYKKICLIYNCGYCMGKKMFVVDQQIRNSAPPPSVATPTPSQMQGWCYDQDPYWCWNTGTFFCHDYSFRSYCCATCGMNG